MGGEGSGFQGTRKTTVEECTVLDINQLIKHGVFSSGYSSGVIRWTDSLTGDETVSVGYSFEGVGQGWRLRLMWRICRGSRLWSRWGDEGSSPNEIIKEITFLNP